jgi:hypothetical protein
MIIDPSICHVKSALFSSIVGDKFLFCQKKKRWRKANGQSRMDNLDTIWAKYTERRQTKSQHRGLTS